MTRLFAADDGPSLEEAALWDDIAEMAQELRQANADLAEARATIARLEAEITRLRTTTARTQRFQMGAAA